MLMFITMFFEWCFGEHKKPGSLWNQWVEGKDEKKPRDRQAASDDDTCRFCGGKMTVYRDRSLNTESGQIIYCKDCGRTPENEDEENDE